MENESNMTFSILIPCYNIEAYLAKCLESVIQQTHKDWEVILVDDGSTDGTVDIIKYYVTKDNRIKAFFHKENQGVAVTRNLLLEKAAGDYIIFLDGDDWWKSKSGLEKIATASQGKSVDIIVFQYEMVRGDGGRELRSNNTHLLEESMIYTGNEYLKIVLGKKITYQWFPFLYAYKRQLWSDIKFNPNTYALEDEELLYLVILRASRLVVLHEAIYQYRVEREGSLTQPSKRLLYCMLSFCINNISKIEQADTDQEMKALLCDNFSDAYYGVLYGVNYLGKNEAKEIFVALDQYRYLMTYTTNRKNLLLSKAVGIFGPYVTSKLWFMLSNIKRKLILQLR